MANKKQNSGGLVHDAGVAAVAGAVGLAVGAATVAMADPNIRKKVGEGIKDIEEKVGEGREAVMDKVDEAKDKVDEAKHNVAKKLDK